MATVAVTVPDALVPRIVAALQYKFPELTGTQAQIGRQGVRLLLMDALLMAEQNTARINARRDSDDAIAAAVDQALADGSTIS